MLQTLRARLERLPVLTPGGEGQAEGSKTHHYTGIACPDMKKVGRLLFVENNPSPPQNGVRRAGRVVGVGWTADS